jgi:hypothetical protein
VLEWRHPDGSSQSIEVEGSGRGEVMTHRPGQESTFWEASWVVLPTQAERESHILGRRGDTLRELAD